MCTNQKSGQAQTQHGTLWRCVKETKYFPCFENCVPSSWVPSSFSVSHQHEVSAAGRLAVNCGLWKCYSADCCTSCTTRPGMEQNMLSTLLDRICWECLKEILHSAFRMFDMDTYSGRKKGNCVLEMTFVWVVRTDRKQLGNVQRHF